MVVALHTGCSVAVADVGIVTVAVEIDSPDPAIPALALAVTGVVGCPCHAVVTGF